MFALLFQHKTNKSLYCYFFILYILYLSGFLNRILRHTHLENKYIFIVYDNSLIYVSMPDALVKPTGYEHFACVSLQF